MLIADALFSTVTITITVFVSHFCSFLYLIASQGSVNMLIDMLFMDDFVLIVVVQ